MISSKSGVLLVAAVIAVGILQRNTVGDIQEKLRYTLLSDTTNWADARVNEMLDNAKVYRQPRIKKAHEGEIEIKLDALSLKLRSMVTPRYQGRRPRRINVQREHFDGTLVSISYHNPNPKGNYKPGEYYKERYVVTDAAIIPTLKAIDQALAFYKKDITGPSSKYPLAIYFRPTTRPDSIQTQIEKVKWTQWTLGATANFSITNFQPDFRF